MKIGLVLAGGGARGAYQIGVWRALTELGIDKYIEVVSGTSIGAINAMLFQQGDYNLAEEFWHTVTKDQILPMDERELGIKGLLFALGAKNMNFVKKYMPKAVKAGSLTREGMQEFLDRIDFDKVRTSNVRGYAACTRIPELKAEYFHINEHSVDDIKKIMFATSAVPMIYDSQDIGNLNYLDGAIVDNVPIQPVYGEGCDIIIVVQLSTEHLIDKSMFPNTNIIELIPEDVDGPDLKDILDFDVNIIKKRITKGYRDTIYSFKPLMEIGKLINSNENINIKSESKFEKLKTIFKR